MEPPAHIPDHPAPDEVVSRDDRRIRAAQDVLRTTVRDVYAGHFGVQAPPETWRLQLQVRVSPADQWNLEFDPPLLEQLVQQLADHAAARETVKIGRVYCYRCGSSGCPHAAAPSASQVFKGYDETGRPEWHEFVQALLDEKDERVDRLFAKPPRLVARFQYGREVKGRQLAAFGKGSLSYSILGQVIAGYMERNGERMAVSLQFVEARDGRGDLLLRLNPVGFGLDDASLVEWLASESRYGLFRAVQRAERELSGLERSARAARARADRPRLQALLGRIPGVARRLVEALERGDRQGERRTRHVEARRQDQRPVHKAIEDADQAGAPDWYRDEKADTWVVVGDRGRVHAFNREGRHVTSFLMKPSAVAFRERTGRWRKLTEEEWSALPARRSEAGAGDVADET